jgi:heme exporter protein A
VRQEALLVAGLAIARGGRLLVSGLDLSLAPGEALLLTGPNGAGKTSLIRCLAGLLPPFEGRIDNPFAVALAGTEPALKPEQRLGAELGFWARLDGADAAARARAVEAMALAPLLELPCGWLSAGQRQRAALARVIASGAPLWLLDEPSAMLDSASTARLETALAAHLAQGGLAIAATHQPLAIPGARTLALGG